MNPILLLGAGFSRNWGDWLADEAFEYLLGCRQVDDGIRALLWQHKRRGGFEGALAELQADHRQRGNSITETNLRKLQDAIIDMFQDMDTAFAKTEFELGETSASPVRTFLFRFNAIFTLNQDQLLERYYLNQNFSSLKLFRGRGHAIPGMGEVPGTAPDVQRPNLCKMKPLDSLNLAVQAGIQPYIKLHGSSNWIDSKGVPLIAMGGNKSTTIEHYPVLKGYQNYFFQHLSKPDTRVMVIGYGFGDDHINQAIVSAAQRDNLRVFIIDPLGVDVLDANRRAAMHTPGPVAGELNPHVIGASRRTLREIFGSDKVEYAKVMRFFD
jgi:hypothetical protein